MPDAPPHASPVSAGAARPQALPTDRRRIDRDQARRVADAFAAAPREAPAARAAAVAAYAALAEQSSRWFALLTSDRVRHPVRVAFTRCREPYATAAELAEGVRRTGTLELWPTSWDPDRRHPLLDTRLGAAYDRVRAVHDLLSHRWFGHGFDQDGEYSAWVAEDRFCYTGLARLALATELHAENSVQWALGHEPDHKAVLLDRALLTASRRGGRWGAPRCAPQDR